MGNSLNLGPQYDDDDVEELQNLKNHNEKIAKKITKKRIKGKGILDDNLDDSISKTKASVCDQGVIDIISNPYMLVVAGICVLLVLSLSNGKKSANEEVDYSSVTSVSELELKLGQIHHWCLNGDDGSCTCEDPLTPRSGMGADWFDAHDDNIFQAESFSSRVTSQDVVFLGDVIPELWAGGRGESRPLYTRKVKALFSRMFERNKAPVDGLALGIDGDTTTNLLWRIRNGELPDDLNPKIWWIFTGINDIRVKGCSHEVTSMAIIRLVEELQMARPGSKIVLNGILPSSGNEGFGPKAWNESKLTNGALFKFSRQHENIELFDPSPSFIDMEKYKKGNKKKSITLNQGLFADEKNLSFYGHQMLLEKIQRKVLTLLVN